MLRILRFIVMRSNRQQQSQTTLQFEIVSQIRFVHVVPNLNSESPCRTRTIRYDGVMRKLLGCVRGAGHNSGKIDPLPPQPNDRIKWDSQGGELRSRTKGCDSERPRLNHDSWITSKQFISWRAGKTSHLKRPFFSTKWLKSKVIVWGINDPSHHII